MSHKWVVKILVRSALLYTQGHLPFQGSFKSSCIRIFSPIFWYFYGRSNKVPNPHSLYIANWGALFYDREILGTITHAQFLCQIISYPAIPIPVKPIITWKFFRTREPFGKGSTGVCDWWRKKVNWQTQLWVDLFYYFPWTITPSVGHLGIFCHFKQVFCRNGLPRLAVGLGSHYQVPSRAGIISWSGLKC